MNKSIFQLLFSILFILTACNQEVSDKKGNPNTNEWQSLFNEKNLDGWIDVNTSNETWHVKDEMIICSGNPIGVMRSAKQYENFIMESVFCRVGIIRIVNDQFKPDGERRNQLHYQSLRHR